MAKWMPAAPRSRAAIDHRSTSPMLLGRGLVTVCIAAPPGVWLSGKYRPVSSRSHSISPTAPVGRQRRDRSHRLCKPPRVTEPLGETPRLQTVLAEWGRIGCLGFGGPPTHIAMLRDLCVTRRGWLAPEEFEDAVAGCNLLPGPSSTQLAIYCARTGAGPPRCDRRWCGVHPSGSRPDPCAGRAVPLRVAATLGAWGGRRSRSRRRRSRGARGLGTRSRQLAARPHQASPLRWTAYVALGAISAATLGPWLVFVLLACGGTELVARGFDRDGPGLGAFTPVFVAGAAAATGGIASLVWVALKVGALSYGGGFVIIPLMQADAVDRYHWMTNGQFLDAVALGQITPGPVVQTVAVVGYAAAGVGGGLLAAAVAFAPSFLFIVVGARHFDRLRANPHARAFSTAPAPPPSARSSAPLSPSR